MTSMDVGTPLYKSPEMVNDNISVPSMDLWALGCMIYEMLTGVTPFHDTNEMEVYDKIVECRYDKRPEGLDPDAADLIEKLLQLNPRERLGAGAEGSGYGYDTLKAHPFFASVNLWDIKQSKTAPIDQEAFSRYQAELKAYQDRISSSNMGAQEETKMSFRTSEEFVQSLEAPIEPLTRTKIPLSSVFGQANSESSAAA